MRILYYIHGLNVGGAEAFIYNIVSVTDFMKYKIDIAIQSSSNKNNKLIRLCEEKAIPIYHICCYKDNYCKSKKDLYTLVKRNQYDVIHYHANALINILPIIVAKKLNTRIIVHSHNTCNNQGGILGKAVHYWNRFWYIKSVEKIACGVNAGKWMYGRYPFTVIYNAIDVNKYCYNESHRNEIRELLNIDKDSFVLGHIGRMEKAKNHKYVIQCFYELLHWNEKAHLVLIGNGSLEKEIRKKIKDYHIENRVHLIGATQQAYKYYSAFDCMYFPSLFEGVSFSMIEAQAAGLPILASDTISEEVKVTDLISFMSVGDIGNWIKHTLSICSGYRDRKKYKAIMSESKYNITNTASALFEIYEGSER